MIQKNKIRPWYKKKRYIVSGLVLAGIIIASANNSSIPIQNTQGVGINPVSQTQELPTYNASRQQETNPSYLSNDNYYINSSGVQVHSPAYSNTIPAGASAQCRDGTYSFSQSRRGTCSHHGGVAQWL